jgi:hypothetical protein
MMNAIFWDIKPSSYFTGDTLRPHYRDQLNVSQNLFAEPYDSLPKPLINIIGLPTMNRTRDLANKSATDLVVL